LESILSKVALLVGLVIGITVHECAHAWSANELGDPTARYQGRISLNPIVHLDPLGSLLMLYSLLAGFGIGWGKPTPVNPFNLRYGPYLGLAITSVAGPISNVLVAIIFAIPLRLGLPMPGELSVFVLYVIVANISLAVFNLLPLPPLDGFSILQGILSQIPGLWSYQVAQWFRLAASQGPLLFIGLLAVDWMIPGVGIFGMLMGPPFRFLFDLIVGI
jgi:Zn-dependent protease